MNFKTSVAVIGKSPARVIAASDFGTSLTEEGFGQYIIAFPGNLVVVGCIATLNNSEGMITAIPGSTASLPHNQVRVCTFDPNGTFTGTVDFTLAAFRS